MGGAAVEYCRPMHGLGVVAARAANIEWPLPLATTVSTDVY